MLARLLERGKTSGRDDDNVESIKKRFSKFSYMHRVLQLMAKGPLSRLLCLSSITIDNTERS